MTLKTSLLNVDELAVLPAGAALIVDCRFDLAVPEGGAQAFLAAHIPGSVYASLDRDLSDLSRQTQGLGRHPLPLAAAFSALLSRWGWQRGMPVISYDAAGGALAAARLWWLLRLAGVADAAVLDGGFPAWLAAGSPLEQGAARERTASAVKLEFDASAAITDHASLRNGAGMLLDARAAARYRGEVEPLDRVGGHVPGARNRPFSENLDGTGRFKSIDRLRQEFATLLGDTDPAQVVHMCGSGVTACHNLLAMEHAGLSGSRLYAPSWSGWVSDPQRPVATG